jgi:hypothetical protein
VAYREGKRSRLERYTVVEPVKGSPLVLVEQPFEGDPRTVAEQLARERGLWHGETYIPPHRIDRVRLSEPPPRPCLSRAAPYEALPCHAWRPGCQSASPCVKYILPGRNALWLGGGETALGT